ncbi:MAG: ComF family protein [Treponema sp.]|nr:ComF family protein [Treponema sp.]
MKRILYLSKQFVKLFLRCIFCYIAGGQTCIICGKKTFLYPVCTECRHTRFTDSLTRCSSLYENRCQICGKPLLSTKKTCFACRENQLLKSTDSMLPLYSYRLWNKELMFLWKTQEIRVISNMFAKFLNPVLKRMEAQFIVPVPPRKGKINQKGWDQIDELCSLLQYRYGYKILRILERRTKIQQKKLDREGRLQQIGHAYCCISASARTKLLKPYGGRLPQTVVLLDDVCTTGATIESCARVLKEVGIKHVNALSLFIVD